MNLAYNLVPEMSCWWQSASTTP